MLAGKTSHQPLPQYRSEMELLRKQGACSSSDFEVSVPGLLISQKTSWWPLRQTSAFFEKLEVGQRSLTGPLRCGEPALERPLRCPSSFSKCILEAFIRASSLFLFLCVCVVVCVRAHTHSYDMYMYMIDMYMPARTMQLGVRVKKKVLYHRCNFS